MESHIALDAEAAYQAVASRDARFDGRFFVGVTSTGIYCRPICRVRTPSARNCRFFATPARAEAEAFRPCMKCRPEIAPGAGLAWSVMDASRTLAIQAAGALDAQLGADEPASLAQLAAHLGVSDRHLRRIFEREHGVTPLQYLQTRRLLLAKQLLTDTRLPVAQIALASGFASLRRFNAAFVESYRMNPSRLRRQSAETSRAADAAARAAPETMLEVKLAYRAPYDVGALTRFIARRAVPEVEQVDGRRLRRSVRAGALGPVAGWLEVEFDATAPLVRLRYAAALAPSSARVVAAVRRWLDLDAAPQTIDAALAALPGAPGLRLPGSVDPFELALRAILGQQVTVAAARTLAKRLVERFGTPIATPWADIARCVPTPETMAAASIDQIAELGIIRSRASAIVALAQAWPELSRLATPPGRPEALVEALCRVPGIGPWTAHYLAMRTLGWPDAFPPNDVAALKAMRQLFATTSTRQADAYALAWQPWRSYALLRLWQSLDPPIADADAASQPSSPTVRARARARARRVDAPRRRVPDRLAMKEPR